MNEKISKSHAMCIQVVTQVFAEFWKDNHQANFQLINDKNTYRKQIPISPPLFFLFQCLYAKNTPIRLFPLVYSWMYNCSWIFLGVQSFLDNPGRTIIPGYSRAYNYSWIRKNHQILVLWVYFCWFIFYIFDAGYRINGAQ